MGGARVIWMQHTYRQRAVEHMSRVSLCPSWEGPPETREGKESDERAYKQAHPPTETETIAKHSQTYTHTNRFTARTRYAGQSHTHMCTLAQSGGGRTG